MIQSLIHVSPSCFDLCNIVREIQNCESIEWEIRTPQVATRVGSLENDDYVVRPD